MSWAISSSGDISMTRGDTPSFKVDILIKGDDGETHRYIPLDTDIIVFAMKKCECMGCEGTIFEKIVPNDTLTFTFEEEDTKNLEYGTYIYEVSLNSGDYHCTFITNKKIKIKTEIH